ncbi:FimV/HubP family polar landmark protein [Thalassolituus hydrocarboniclasticus]|uniref:LysM domain-containing protein n=1 Tax=Thalassolituus hydrocarboniclasticus TaxID=2742796 RepID=A0ABY6ABS7_9GAMM|nr:FimV/HubP family polar landmark protein [Thalassolituus hydrocarboniclasticus]UXD87370.1 hypothetical protein HUF19_07970 [Thalassolituus hydrocarboniclasticus]
MKRLLANTLMLVGGLTASSQLLALGLGELTLKSALNQPLQAEIELVETDGLSQWEIKPALASASDFERAGVDRLYFLTKITFKVEGDRVVLTSREPVNEPFLNFLVELNWPSGRVLREYTLLLDPPTFQEESIRPLVTSPAGQGAVVSSPAESGTATIAAPAQPVAVNRWDSEPAAPGTYKVQPDDTLWQIALETRPASGVTPQQMMLAIQNENPNAFIAGNINRLKTHQVLRIPDAEAIKRVSFGQAVAEVDRQNRALNAGAAQIDATGRRGAAGAAATAKDGGEVRLLSAQTDDSDSAGTSGDIGQGTGSGRQQALENDLAIALENVDKSRRENQELRERLESLEEQINTLQRLISLKDDQLATMQVDGAQQAAEATEAAPADVASAETTEAATDVAPEAAPAADADAAQGEENIDFNYAQPADNTAVTATDVAPQSEAEAAAKAAEEQARRDRVAAMLAQQEAQQRPKPGLMDQMLRNPQYPLAGFGVLVLLGLLIARALKQRKAAKQEEEFNGEELAFADVDADPSSLDDFDFEDDLTADNDLDTDHADMDLGEGLDDSEHHEEHFETVAQTEDVISESDIYIAYGKFEQAVDLLSDAIEKEPSRSDLRLKLLEVYVEMDEAEAFAVAEAGLNQLGDRAASQQAEQLRNRLSSPIAPAAALSALAADTAADAGLSLDDDIPALDDSMGEDFADALDFGDALDLSEDMPEESSDAVLDLGASDSGLEEVPTLDLDDGLEFDLNESAPKLDAEVEDAADDEFDIAAEPSSEGDGLEFDLGDFDTETPVAEEAAPVVTEDDDHSLDFDLGSLSADDSAEAEPVAESSDTAAADDDFSLDFDGGDLTSAAADSDLSDLESLLDGDAAGAGELSDLSFDMEENTGFAQAEGDDDLKALEQELDAMATSPVADAEDDFSFETSDSDDDLSALAAEGGDSDDVMDFSADLADLDSELEGEEVPVVDDQLEVPQVAGSGAVDNADIDLDELAAADDEFDFLAGTDECATKLDLARAYIDMEDFDGARELLQEVVQEGSDQQKADARSLMDNLA